MQSARPPFPSRRPSPALSRTCRPLSFASRAPHALPSHLCTRCQQVSRSEGSGGWAQEGRLAGCWAGKWLQRGCRMAASAGSRWQHVCMAASANTWLLFVFVVVYVPLYSFLCKQVWDGAHPCWDAFTGLCVYIKSSSNQLKSSVRNHEQSLYMYSSKLTSNPKMRNKAHGSVRRAPPLHPSFGGEEGSQIKLKATQPSSTSSPVGGGRGVMGVSPRGRWGSPRVGLPME